MSQTKLQSGFSMIEVLVSILLTTIGLLGIVGLLLSGVSNSTGADLASRASQSANQIMDAMRANSTQVNSYVIAYGKKASDVTGTTVDKVDLRLWLTSVQALPGGEGKIEADPDAVTHPNEFIISIRFTNCLGTISLDQSNKCKNADGSTEKRTIAYRLKI